MKNPIRAYFDPNTRKCLKPVHFAAPFATPAQRQMIEWNKRSRRWIAEVSR